MKRMDELKEKLQEEKILISEYGIGDPIQLSAVENRRNPGKVAFIMPDGKIGFPSRNSLATNIGDIIQGNIEVITDTYVFITVTEIISRGGAQ